MNSSQTLSSGTSLYRGDYRIVSVLGRGGFGITYLAVMENIGKRVAIKEFFPRGMYNRESDMSDASIASKENAELSHRLKAKFLSEARRLASLKHDSIVAVNNAFEENGTAYYVMDFIDGRDLQTIVKEDGPLSLTRAIGYIRQVGDALIYLHNLHINHLDVKPANIIVDSTSDRAMLIDFGLSKHYDKGGNQTSTTPVGISAGYAPMEQYKSGGVSEFSAQTDVYSLGATLYYLLTGERPSEAPSLVDEVLVFPTAVPDYVQAAIIKAMSPSRSGRYHTVEAFLAALNPPQAASSTADEATTIRHPITFPSRPIKVITNQQVPKGEKNSNEEGTSSGCLIAGFIIIILVIVLLAIFKTQGEKTGNEVDSLEAVEAAAVEEIAPEYETYDIGGNNVDERVNEAYSANNQYGLDSEPGGITWGGEDIVWSENQ